ncbi:hypothetical protein XO10_07965 [Marinitoga sp. 1135]|uniref:ATP-binding cassette domain-containing protein n=1 Tax=unclassified Marinitoga TaxID=2640159 RepID=UPI0015865A77|nr:MULTISPECIES: ABC transporter ATP-binding protein [unclassified Marinitoga]NUU96195.1 hypothetical protein [Marinitoga sp. 1135]NUU98118.1 hypothetical protein [Marinitoga sp. 1138]
MKLKTKNNILFVLEILLRVGYGIAIPLLLKWIIDMSIKSPEKALYGAYIYSAMVLIELMLLLYFGVKNRHIWPHFYTEKIKSLILKGLYDKNKKHENGKLINIIFDDSYNVVEPTQIFFAMLYARLIKTFIAFGIIWYIAGLKYFLISLIYLAVLGINSYIIHKIKYDEINNAYKNLMDHYLDFISGNKVIYQYNIFDSFYKLKEKHEIKNIKEQMKYYIKYVFGNLLNSISTVIYNVMMVYLLVNDIKTGILTLGTYFMIFQFKEDITDPPEVLYFLLNEFKKIKVSREKVKEIEEISTENTYEIVGNDYIEKPEIAVEKLKFGYNGKNKIFENLDFKFSGPGLYLIRGKSGIGKSTLIKILLKFFEPEYGNILINGKNIKEVSPEYLKRNIKVLMQDSYHIRGTIKENIDFGRNHEEEKIKETMRKTGLEDLDVNYTIDFNGENISGGQLKRVLIGRTIIDDSQIVIFDEPFVNIDNKNKELIIEILEKIKEKKMCIVITHDHILDTKADKILELG